MKTTSLLLSLILLPVFLAAQETNRTWTDVQNRTLEARMLSGTADTVTVMTPAGHTHILQLETLSEADQAYVRQRQGQGRAQAAAAGARRATWLTRIDQAKTESERLDMPIFLLFTGSDWCPPCMQLERNVFEKREFQEFANEKLVLLMADFPRNRRLSASQQSANQALAREYGVRGYPTMLLLNADGTVRQRFGYSGQDAAGFVAMLQNHLR